MGKLRAVFDIVLFPIYRIAVRLNLYFIAAIIACCLLTRVNGKRHKKLLFLDRSIFRADIEAMANRSGDIQYVGLERKYLWEIFNKYLDKAEVSETNYHSEGTLERPRRELFEWVTRLFLILHKLIRFDGIITCNFGYLDQQELFFVAKNQTWPVFVLFKEGMLPELQLEELFKEYGKKYLNCRLVMTANIHLCQMFQNSDIPGKDATRFAPVGIPRLDGYKDIAESNSKSDILFLSFFPADKISYASFTDPYRKVIVDISEQFHRMVIRLAVERRDLNIVIKTKVAEHYVDYVEEIARSEYKSYRSLPNLRITNEGRATDLIKRSSHILGSQSTGLLEGLLANRSVGRPRFPDGFECDNDFLYGYDTLVSSIREFEDLIKFVDERSSDLLRNERLRDQLLKKLVFTVNYNASELAEKEILLELLSERK